jgi:hypothetical protein
MQVFAQRRESVADPESRVHDAPELRLLRAVEHERHARVLARYGVRVLGALALFSVGAVHLQQYLYLYSAIPTIGTVFLLNFAGATAIGFALIAPTERLLGRWGSPSVTLLALAGAVLAATAFTFLLVSERTPIFGFMEPGYDPPAIMAARVSELVTVAVLGAFVVARLAAGARRGRR